MTEPITDKKFIRRNNGGYRSNGAGNMFQKYNYNVLTKTDLAIASLQVDVNDIKENIFELRKEIWGLHKLMLGLFFGGFIAVIIGIAIYNNIQESKFDKFFDVKIQNMEVKLDAKLDRIEDKIDAQNKEFNDKFNAYMEANEKSYNLAMEALKKASE
jgi:hypothetical protein